MNFENIEKVDYASACWIRVTILLYQTHPGEWICGFQFKPKHHKGRAKEGDGRIDLLIETPKYVYIIEIKRDSTPKDALKQIHEKDYALQFRKDAREIFLVGMNFSTEKKRLDGFLMNLY